MPERDARPLRVAVVGAGAFGRNHLRVYRELEQAGAPVELAAIVDPNEATRSAATAKYAISGFASIDECLAACKLDAASLCVPTVHHAACARTLLAAGVDLLIEKPIAAGLAEADEIVSLAHELGRTVQVGHLERFNPAVRALRSLLNHPMFFEVHRLSVFTPRSLDVDVVLDLMVHDLDIVLSLVASPVRELRAGLPPGPIANPGVAALKAALAPARTDYLYFVADAEGHSRFSATLKEHTEQVEAYRRSLHQPAPAQSRPTHAHSRAPHRTIHAHTHASAR